MHCLLKTEYSVFNYIYTEFLIMLFFARILITSHKRLTKCLLKRIDRSFDSSTDKTKRILFPICI